MKEKVVDEVKKDESNNRIEEYDAHKKRKGKIIKRVIIGVIAIIVLFIYIFDYNFALARKGFFKDIHYIEEGQDADGNYYCVVEAKKDGKEYLLRMTKNLINLWYVDIDCEQDGNYNQMRWLSCDTHFEESHIVYAIDYVDGDISRKDFYVPDNSIVKIYKGQDKRKYVSITSIFGNDDDITQLNSVNVYEDLEEKGFIKK